MKKNIIFAFISATLLTLSSCGTLGGNTAMNGNQANNTANLLGTALLGANGSSSNLLGAVMGQLMQGQTTKEQLLGAWTYSAPKVIFESDNLLAQLGSTVASSQIESKLTEYLTKMGVTAGKTQVIFQEDGVCAFTIKGQPVQGTYTYNAETKQLTMVGAFGYGNLTCYATVNGRELDLVFEANKLLDLASKATSLTSSAKTLTSLLANYKGLKLGMALTK